MGWVEPSGPAMIVVSGGVVSGAGLTATPRGPLPTAIVPVTVLVAVLITETVSGPALVTYTRVPSGVTATPDGALPTVTVAVRRLVAVLSTETLPEASLAT